MDEFELLKNEITLLVLKGVDDGQYYREQTLVNAQPPSQPQVDQYQTSWLNSDFRRPDRDTYRSDNQYINMEVNDVACPYCGFFTLANATSADDIGSTPTFRCVQCGSMVSMQEMVDAQFLMEMYRTMTENPDDTAITVPKWSPKSFKIPTELDLDVKEYSCMDMKSFEGFEAYADSPEYRKILMGYLTDVPKDKVELIITIIKEGIAQNLSIGQIREKLAKILSDRDRAELLARTEVMRITNEANRQRIKDKGVNVVEWIAGPNDGRTCELCISLDGKRFSVTAIKNKLPLHPRCRCTFSEVPYI